MTYREYLKAVDKRFPAMNVSMIPISAPEMLKLVAAELFIVNDTDSKLVTETREHLLNLRKYGKLDFENYNGTTVEGTVKTRKGISDFA